MATIVSNDRGLQFKRILAFLKKGHGVLPENKEIMLRFTRDAQLGKTVKGRSKKKLGHAILYKYLSILKRLDRYWKKPFDKVTIKDMERFRPDLLEHGKFDEQALDIVAHGDEG